MRKKSQKKSSVTKKASLSSMYQTFFSSRNHVQIDVFKQKYKMQPEPSLLQLVRTETIYFPGKQ
jgi:hypothetical protein